jgi:hypothetical protein
MIPVFIIWLIRRYKQNQKKNKSAPGLKKSKTFLTVLTGALIIMQFATLNVFAQSKLLNYQIVRNGSKVGTLRFSETTSAGMDYLKMESDVKTRFIFTFIAHALEEAVYFNGVLLRSSIYRQLNGNEKANKQHQATNRQYIVYKGNETEVLNNFPITYNMLSLYSKEPESVSKVYSDNFETFLAIQQPEPHKYKVTLPDGNYNYYYYKNGILNQIEVHHSIYSANIILMN